MERAHDLRRGAAGALPLRRVLRTAKPRPFRVLSLQEASAGPPQPVAMKPVGHRLQITWNDGHAAGIYGLRPGNRGSESKRCRSVDVHSREERVGQEVRHLLEGADDPVHTEFDPGLDRPAIRARVAALRPELEEIAGRAFELDDRAQDASFFADLSLQRPGPKPNWIDTVFAVRFSNFGSLFTTWSHCQAEHLPDEVVDQLLAAVSRAGFRYVPAAASIHGCHRVSAHQWSVLRLHGHSATAAPTTYNRDSSNPKLSLGMKRRSRNRQRKGGVSDPPSRASRSAHIRYRQSDRREYLQPPYQCLRPQHVDLSSAIPAPCSA